jgi:hypothetical protein
MFCLIFCCTLKSSEMQYFEQILSRMDQRAVLMEKKLNHNTEQLQRILDRLGALEVDLHAQELRISSNSLKSRESIENNFTSMNSLVMESLRDCLETFERRIIEKTDDVEQSLTERLARFETNQRDNFRHRIGTLESSMRRAIRGNGVGPVVPTHKQQLIRKGSTIQPPLPLLAPRGLGGNKEPRNGTALLTRLKPGMVLSHVRSLFEDRALLAATGRFDWVEYWFGICQPAEVITGPNDTVRQSRTRVIHPASRFNIGAAPGPGACPARGACGVPRQWEVTGPACAPHGLARICPFAAVPARARLRRHNQCSLTRARGRAVVTGISAGLLVYSALLVPVQLSFWLSDDPCYLYPTVHVVPSRPPSSPHVPPLSPFVPSSDPRRLSLSPLEPLVA